MLMENTAMKTSASKSTESWQRAERPVQDGEPTSMTAQQRMAARYASQADEDGKRRLHHSPLFWGGVVLFVCAIGVYVFTDSLAWLPRRGG